MAQRVPFRNEGANSLAATTSAFNEWKVPTPRGAQLHVSTVANLLARAQKLERFARPSEVFIDGSSALATTQHSKKVSRRGGRLEGGLQGSQVAQGSRTRRPPLF
jgi:hypothetical protein